MRFAPEFILKVQESTDLVAIANEYTELKRKGKNLMARCPLPGHADKTASFSVSEEKQVFYCFGCHGKGNVFTFIQQMQGHGFPDAVEYLARRAGIEVPKLTQENHYIAEKSQDEKKEMLRAMELAEGFFAREFSNLPDGHNVKGYARGRQLTDEICEIFGVGYAPDDWEKLTLYLKQKAIQPEIAESLGLIRGRKAPATGYYDLFRHRLMFPIYSSFGDVIGFGGRILDGEGPKYINSPESPVFNKRKTLYGIHATARYIRSDDCAVIVEGYMDAIALYRSGVQNVAATLGTAFTKGHAQAIKRMTKNVVILFDGDEAGQRAAEQALPVLLAEGLYPRALTLAEGSDPDDFIRNYGVDQLKIEISQAPEMFEWVIQRWFEGYKGEPSQKLKLVDQVAPILFAIPERSLAQLYAQIYATRLSVPLGWLRDAVRARRKKVPELHGKSQKSTSDSQNLHQQPRSMQKSGQRNHEDIEWILLGMTARHIQNYEHIKPYNPAQYLHGPESQKLWYKLDEAGQVAERFDKLASHLMNTEDLPDSFHRTLHEDVGDRESELRLINDCLMRLKEHHLKAQSMQLAVELKAHFDYKKMEEFVNVQRMRLLKNEGKLSDTNNEE